MSASRIPTLRPSALRPSARLTAVVDLPTPPLPEATAMMASTPGTPCIDSPRGGAGLALCRQCDEGRSHARQRAHNFFRALAHRLPGFDIGGIDRDGKEDLAVAGDHLRKRAGRRQRDAPRALDAFKCCEHVLLGHRHRTVLHRIIRNQHHRRRAGPVNVMTVDVRAAPSQSLPDIGIRALAWQCSREDSMAKVAFLGLGVMGYPMAGHLKNKGGHDVTVYNRSAAKAEKWVAQYGGRSASTPKAAAEGQDFVMCCVGNDNDLREVTLGPNGAFHGVKKDAVFVDHTTASAEIARELYAQAKQRGFGFVDAPVSGGQAGAENGVLTVMCGGDAEPYARAEKVIGSYARMCKLLGPAGAGQLTKMVNQICIAGLVQGLAEGIHFAKKAGLDVEAVIDTISKGAAQSWQMENRYKTMAAGKFDFGFAVDWMRKDLAICLGEARKNGATLPVSALVDQFYAEVQKMGGRRWDTSSLIARLER